MVHLREADMEKRKEEKENFELMNVAVFSVWNFVPRNKDKFKFI